MTTTRQGGSGRAVVSRVALAVALAAVVLVVLLQGRSDSPSGVGADDVGPAPTSQPTDSPPSTDREFCAGFRELAAAQAQYLAAGSSDFGALRDVAHRMVDIGVPASMDTLARTGYYVEIAGVYESIGEELDRDAVPGALADAGSGTSVSGTAGAFGSWLAEFCPAG